MLFGGGAILLWVIPFFMKLRNFAKNAAQAEMQHYGKIKSLGIGQ